MFIQVQGSGWKCIYILSQSIINVIGQNKTYKVTVFLKTFIYFELEDNCFTILYWVLPNISMNQPRVYICSLPLEPPSSLPPHPTPVGCHRVRVWAPWVMTANSHQLPISHMVTYMFPCYSVSSSRPPHPLLCPQVCSLCLCLHCRPVEGLIRRMSLNSRSHACLWWGYLCISLWPEFGMHSFRVVLSLLLPDTLKILAFWKHFHLNFLAWRFLDHGNLYT